MYNEQRGRTLLDQQRGTKKAVKRNERDRTGEYKAGTSKKLSENPTWDELFEYPFLS